MMVGNYEFFVQLLAIYSYFIHGKKRINYFREREREKKKKKKNNKKKK